jgi:hypothetical protein
MSSTEDSSGAQTVTTGWQALELFTNRHGLFRRILSRTHTNDGLAPVFFLHGQGGIGKSLFLKFLKRYARRLDARAWEMLASSSDAEFMASVMRDADAAPLSIAFIDFAAPGSSEDAPRLPLPSMLAIRRQLSNGGVRTDRFNFGLLWHLHKDGRLSPQRMQELFPMEEIGFMAALVDALMQNSIGSVISSVLAIFDKHLKSRVGMYVHRRRVSVEEFQAIADLEAIGELHAAFPRLLAQDLTDHDQTAARGILLIFDAHDSLWGSSRHVISNAERDDTDAWLRQFVISIPPSAHVTIVIAAQTPPAWSTCHAYPVPFERVQVVQMTGLEPQYADEYLKRAGLANPGLRTKVASFARMDDGTFHPFSLGLCRDIARYVHDDELRWDSDDLVVTPRHAEIATVLIDRLCRYLTSDLEQALRAAAACRYFDFDRFAALCEAMKLGSARSDQR